MFFKHKKIPQKHFHFIKEKKKNNEDNLQQQKLTIHGTR
jgi:hypothetical protein